MKQTCFDKYLTLVRATPASWSIDLRTHSFRFDRKDIIKDGAYVNPDDNDDALLLDGSTVLNDIESAFLKFCHSVPSADHRVTYLHGTPLPLDELTKDDMLYGIPRREAQFSYEYLLLLAILRGLITPITLGMKPNEWFWSSPRCSLKIKRQWLLH